MKELWREITEWFKNCCKDSPRATVLWIAAVLLIAISIAIGVSACAWLPSFISAIVIIAYIYRLQIIDFMQKAKINRLKILNLLEISFSMQESSIHSIHDDANEILNSLNLDSLSKDNLSIIEEKAKNIKRRTEEVQENIKKSKGKIEMPQIKDILAHNELIEKDPLEVGSNANGKYVKFKNGLMIITKVLDGIGAQEYTSEQIRIVYPAMFAGSPLFAQFIGIEQPKIIHMGDGYLTIELQKRVTTTVTLNVMGMWKSLDLG
ncbi:hypothetical protein [Cloacibacillus porcorum]|jgi:hypothetical protein|uniref:Uncharacterized protein n=1 Tax=Cloacibacillus porcorum TaxID=1197717 RepID=A0A1B2I3W5_9BACT|nr:hypothetical protein [Cloacibacillus porcorum]ANZ44623.1 hypothetical protein BED41_05680 [Cloacibacillus porcorum]